METTKDEKPKLWVARLGLRCVSFFYYIIGGYFIHLIWNITTNILGFSDLNLTLYEATILWIICY